MASNKYQVLSLKFGAATQILDSYPARDTLLQTSDFRLLTFQTGGLA